MKYATPLFCALVWLATACDEGNDNGDEDTSTSDATDVGEEETIANRAPVIATTAPTSVFVWEMIDYQIVCTDADGDDLTLSTGDEDDCVGVLTDAGDGTGSYVLDVTLDMSDSSCILAIECSDGLESVVQNVDLAIGGETDISDLTFGEFVPWATPITDYIETNTTVLGHSSFMKDIFDMTVFEGNLYFGYGDANENLGRNTPIELRYWPTPDPEGWTFDFTTDEEQVSRFRTYDDLLLVPGIDATEDAFLGNAYSKAAGADWVKSRTLDMGWHVHDAVRHQGALYACGSGGTADDYTNSTVNAFVWSSDDDGAVFTIQVQQPHPDPPGDQRIVHLISAGGQLYAFGYYTDGEVSYAANYRVFGDSLMAFSGMPSFFVDDAWSLAGDRAILTGVHISDPLNNGTLLLMGTSATSIMDLETSSMIDVEPLGDARGLLIYYEGDAYPAASTGPWNVHVSIFTMTQEIVELANQSFDTLPTSIAFWRRELYMGFSDGSVWRSVGN